MLKRISLLLILALISCIDKSTIKKEVLEIPVTISIDRFEEKFNNVDVDRLPYLKKQYPYLFPTMFHDSIWLNKAKDTLQKEIFSEVNKIFPDDVFLKEELTLLFKHALYYFPDQNVPKVITVVSDVDYRNKVILTDSLLILGLDNYLGENHKFYQSIQKYYTKNMKKELLPVHVAALLSQQHLSANKERTLLANMLQQGKEVYIKNILLPLKTDAEKLEYTEDELKWAQANESEIWRYFVERELLFSTDEKLLPRFIYPAPFSKFYLELDNESPGQIGKYIGWKIIVAFMQKNKVSIKEMLSMPAEELFRKSNYKPLK